MFNLICKVCGKEFEAESRTTKYCSADCIKINKSKQKYKDVDGAITCKECGFMGNDIIKHINLKHGSIEEYCKKYNCEKYDLISKNTHENRKNAQKKLIEEGRSHCFTSENNPSKGEDCKNGRNSPYSINFRGYDGLSIEEKQEKIKILCTKSKETMNENNNNPLTLEYYIKRGYSKSKAEEMLKERQSTFSLEKCIEKYGKEEGYKKWKERQDKWQETLNNLPEEEKKRINKAKSNGLLLSKGYSNVSQKLFWKLYEYIKNDYNNIYFATLDKKLKIFTEKNNEYLVEKNNGGWYFLDFYIQDNNKVIEFDDDYWHSEARGNVERDNQREQELINMGFIIKRVKERDYNENPEKVIQECIEFIKS